MLQLSSTSCDGSDTGTCWHPLTLSPMDHTRHLAHEAGGTASLPGSLRVTDEKTEASRKRNDLSRPLGNDRRSPELAYESPRCMNLSRTSCLSAAAQEMDELGEGAGGCSQRSPSEFPHLGPPEKVPEASAGDGFPSPPLALSGGAMESFLRWVQKCHSKKGDQWVDRR